MTGPQGGSATGRATDAPSTPTRSVWSLDASAQPKRMGRRLDRGPSERRDWEEGSQPPPSGSQGPHLSQEETGEGQSQKLEGSSVCASQEQIGDQDSASSNPGGAGSPGLKRGPGADFFSFFKFSKRL